MQVAMNTMSDEELFTPVEWDPERFGIGIKLIDDQHRELLGYINQLSKVYDTILKRQSNGPLQFTRKKSTGVTVRNFEPLLQRGFPAAAVIDELVGYTGKHLAQEDHMLETYGYADRHAQHIDHDLFVEEVAHLHKLVEEYNAQEVDYRRLLVFLRRWMVDHIPKDRKYAHHLIEKGIGN